jgi:hypothetical protein
LFHCNVYEETRVGDECGDLVSYGLNTAGRKSIGDGVKKSDGSWGIDGRYFLKGGVEGCIAAQFTGHKETPRTKNTSDLLKNAWVVTNLEKA